MSLTSNDHYSEWRLRYSIADDSTATLSLNFPRAVLQVEHSRPRTLPVSWLWSMWAAASSTLSPVNLILLRQIPHAPSWDAIIASRSVGVNPYFFFIRIFLAASRAFAGAFALDFLDDPRATSRTCSRLASLHLRCAAFAHSLQRHARPFLLLGSLPKALSGFLLLQVRQSLPSEFSSGGLSTRGCFSLHFLYARWLADRTLSGLFLAQCRVDCDEHFRHRYEIPLLRHDAFPNASIGLLSKHEGHSISILVTMMAGLVYAYGS